MLCLPPFPTPNSIYHRVACWHGRDGFSSPKAIDTIFLKPSIPLNNRLISLLFINWHKHLVFFLNFILSQDKRNKVLAAL